MKTIAYLLAMFGGLYLTLTIVSALMTALGIA